MLLVQSMELTSVVLVQTMELTSVVSLMMMVVVAWPPHFLPLRPPPLLHFSLVLQQQRSCRILPRTRQSCYSQ